MNDRRRAAIVKRITPLHTGFLSVNRYELEVEKHAGETQQLTLEVMERGHAVAVLGYDPVRDEVVLVNEFRVGVLAAGEYPFAENLVAGGIAPDESAIDAAVREMKEEAGLELCDPEVIHPGAYVSPGGTSEKIVIVFGVVDTSKAGGIHGNHDEHEDILTVVLPAPEFIERARAAKINDLKTVVAAYWLAEHRDRRKAPVA